MLLYKRASSGYTTTLGSDHPTTQACLDHQLSLEQLLHRHGTDSSSHGSRHEVADDSTNLPNPGSLESSLLRPDPLPKEHWWRKFKKKCSCSAHVTSRWLFNRTTAISPKHASLSTSVNRCWWAREAWRRGGLNQVFPSVGGRRQRRIPALEGDVML
ncbi:hypothetical protein K469DRAFT_698384 [Zopfia rhizophila CBS 207.26]|uniref:Uncharacterized protein n=1 Tax=Zopfia rhizophila CBS 207.26 TaxID=1314779 RepID=A0A6A6DBN0_9PEZI|nr:hypothetical protein K469DRAFT_698384 [Zopfia rhizophila CBS 207.26]